MAFNATGSGVSMPQKMVEKNASRIPARISGRLAMFSVASQDKRGLAIADEIVVYEVDRSPDAAFEHFVEFGGDLLRRFQTRIAAIKSRDIAELALIGATAR